MRSIASRRLIGLVLLPGCPIRGRPFSLSVAIVERFWRDVWQRLQNPHAINALVAEDFVITSGGKDIVSVRRSSAG
jgi:hypothetical protein